MKRDRLGGLDVIIGGGEYDDGRGDGPVVILLHGFGAPGDDLAALAGLLEVPRDMRFVMPAAPIEFESGFGGGRAWWLIDLMKIQAQLAAGDVRDLSRDVPEGLTEARAAVISLLDDVEERFAVSGSRIVLGGFSQGAMLSMDVALRTSRPLGGLVLMSGTLLAADEWVPLMPARRGMKVFQSHGQRDPLLPFGAATTLRDHLRAAGLSVDWLDFRGGHEIPHIVLDRLAKFLAGLMPA